MTVFKHLVESSHRLFDYAASRVTAECKTPEEFRSQVLAAARKSGPDVEEKVEAYLNMARPKQRTSF